jgi:hypothetical protein
LSEPIPEGPILPFHLNEVDHDILPADLKFVMETVCQSLVEGFFEIDPPAFAERDLDDDDAVCALDIEIVKTIYQVVSSMFRDGLEVILIWDIELFHHGLIDNLANPATKFNGPALHEVNVYQWHKNSPFSYSDFIPIRV